MKIKPYINFVRCDHNFDRASIGGNICYEGTDFYMYFNLVFWNISFGIRFANKKGR